MRLPWETLKDEHSIAVQIIEKETGFMYDPAYGTLRNPSGHPIRYADLEAFFDDQYWIMTILPLEYPNYSGVISDRNGKYIFQNHQVFEGINNRDHAKAMVAGIAIKLFDEFVIENMIKPELEKSSTKAITRSTALNASSKSVVLESISAENLCMDARGEMSIAELFIVSEGDRGKVLKSVNEFPYVGMIVPL